jgi:hypothetical protein
VVACGEIGMPTNSIHCIAGIVDPPGYAAPGLLCVVVIPAGTPMILSMIIESAGMVITPKGGIFKVVSSKKTTTVVS